MSFSILKKYYFLLVFFILISPMPSEAAQADEFITILPAAETQAEGKTNNIKWSIVPEKAGIKSTLEIFFPQPEASALDLNPGWEYRIEIDNRMMLAQGAPPSRDTAIESLISLEEIENGIHTLSLTVMDFKGQRHRIEKKVKLDASPRMLVELKNDNEEELDPEITLSFFGQQNHIGSLEVFLDDMPFSMVDVLIDNNNQPLKLSKLTGSLIYAADMVPGEHLLSITARGRNGSFSTRRLILPVGIHLPEIKIHRKGDRFESVEIGFPKSSTPFKGSAEIRYNRSVILSVNSAKEDLLIPRSSLEKAFEMHKLALDPPVYMTLSAKTPGQAERWLTFPFQ